VTARTLIVTGSGTDVGKTYVTASLLRALRAKGHAPQALKPVMSGFDPGHLADSDAGRLLAALGREVTPEAVAEVAPIRFEALLPPTVAANRNDRMLIFRDVVRACRTAMERTDDILVIEGVGGVMSPMAEGAKVIDLINELEVPALLVSGSYLGAASHALTALSVLDAENIPVIGIVVNESEGTPVTLAETMAMIAPYDHDRRIMALPRGADRGPELAEWVLAEV
jgi:dethiobiotin synthetase